MGENKEEWYNHNEKPISCKKLHISATIETTLQFPAEKKKNLLSLPHLMPVVPMKFYKNPLENYWEKQDSKR
jgi:hypothetical protein